MKKYAVYGVDTVTALKECDTFEDALAFAKKGLRKWGKTIKDTELRKTVYKVHKNNNGEVIEKDYR
ncbi:MAG: hypothetical protein IKT98_03910 [Selenomonadaceae bacterium]|nr:hypothetical protein [Selenomonadaceae bacterium]